MNFKKILFILIAAIALIQLKQIDRTNPESNPDLDYLVLTNAPNEIDNIIKTSCYDCHSNQVKYPWYSYVAPISWIIDSHIQDGRKHLNFSEWGNYADTKQNHKLEECVDELNAGKMPLNSYTIIHSNANLSEADKTALIAWFNKQLKPAETND